MKLDAATFGTGPFCPAIRLNDEVIFLSSSKHKTEDAAFARALRLVRQIESEVRKNMVRRRFSRRVSLAPIEETREAAIGVKILCGATWDECQTAIEEEMERRGTAEATIPVRGGDGRFYAQVRSL